jgi:Fe-S-cluster containining protein
MKIFECMPSCSDCCIKREYYPSEHYGKIGVLVLPGEKEKLEQLASRLGITIKIVPRIAVGKQHQRIVAFQLMGAHTDGNYCPFLDLDPAKTSPHGGKACGIYKHRPLACQAYPVIETDDSRVSLDNHCKFCSVNGDSASQVGLESELEALAKIRSCVKADSGEQIWRYATGVGDSPQLLPEGWINEEDVATS